MKLITAGNQNSQGRAVRYPGDVTSDGKISAMAPRPITTPSNPPFSEKERPGNHGRRAGGRIAPAAQAPSHSTALGIDEMIRQYESGKDIIFFEAPVLILVHVPNLGGLSYVDPAIALTYGMLAAHTMGLGSCWMGFTMIAGQKNKDVLRQFNIPRGRLIAGVMTLGYPVQTYHRVPVRNKIKAGWYV